MTSFGILTVPVANPMRMVLPVILWRTKRWPTHMTGNFSPLLGRGFFGGKSTNTNNFQIPSRRQSTFNLFSIPTFQAFTSNAWDGGGAPNAWTSVESIHNSVHGK